MSPEIAQRQRIHGDGGQDQIKAGQKDNQLVEIPNFQVGIILVLDYQQTDQSDRVKYFHGDIMTNTRNVSTMRRIRIVIMMSL